eukprot:UN09865
MHYYMILKERKYLLNSHEFIALLKTTKTPKDRLDILLQYEKPIYYHLLSSESPQPTQQKCITCLNNNNNNNNIYEMNQNNNINFIPHQYDQYNNQQHQQQHQQQSTEYCTCQTFPFMLSSIEEFNKTALCQLINMQLGISPYPPTLTSHKNTSSSELSSMSTECSPSSLQMGSGLIQN